MTTKAGRRKRDKEANLVVRKGRAIDGDQSRKNEERKRRDFGCKRGRAIDGNQSRKNEE